jgi:hypothetical protein
MTRTKTNSRLYINVFFSVIIVYLIVSLYQEFRCLDFGYLLVITVSFIRFFTVGRKE